MTYRVTILICIVILVIIPINDGFSDVHNPSVNLVSYGRDDRVHIKERPCDTCPRKGQCVPKVSCPGHVRPNAGYPECHLRDTGQIGVCCFSGIKHAAESDHRSRKAKTTETKHIKAIHNSSHTTLKKWFKKAEKLQHSQNTVVRAGTPEFGHYLSLSKADTQTEALGRGGLLNLFAVQELKSRQAIDDEDLMLGFTEHADVLYCPPLPLCPHPATPYRSFTGGCNNPSFTSWGAANTGFERLLPPDYSDGVWAMRLSKSGLPLPSPRAVSVALVPDDSNPSGTHNVLFMQFGQFIAHDVSAAVMFSIGNGSAISCCTQEGWYLPPEQQHWACAPIAVDAGDEFFGHFGRVCLSFVRAQVAPVSECSVGYAKQMNGATHLPDLSHIYGKTLDKLGELRTSGGLLRTFNDYGRELPPLTERVECMTQKERGACFESGDGHGNQIISLTALHTIFTREHNRIARAFTRLNPGWNEEQIFMETRKLVQAMFHHVVYNEWLPLLIGADLMRTFDLFPSPGYSTSYNPEVNPSVLAEFSAAAMRFGHSTVEGKIMASYPQTRGVYELVSIPELMFQPSRLRLQHYLDRLLHGMTSQPMQSVDPFVTVGLTRYMFHGGNPYGLDLASFNIQRGRDYGLRSYNQYRHLIGLPTYNDFDQFPPSARKRLSSVYSSVEDIDLWIGGLLEEPVEGGIVGPTFANIIAEQFRRFKMGDRYFYEYGPDVNPGAFTPIQLQEIKKVTIARILCDNRDGVELVTMPPNAFLRSDMAQNTPIPCDSSYIPSMDLSRFRSA